MSTFEEKLNDLEKEVDALDQSLALNRLIIGILEHTKAQTKVLAILLAISIIVNAFIVGAFLYYESQFEYTVETTETIYDSSETTTQTGEGDSVTFNNGDQYNDNAVNGKD